MRTPTDVPRGKHFHNTLWANPNFLHIHTALMERYRFPHGRRPRVDFPVSLKVRTRKGGMILPKGDLPLEIQSWKGESEVVFRPVQDLSCKWHGFAYTFFRSTSLHPFPISCCDLKERSISRRKRLCLHLGNQWDWLYTKCCKVHKVNQLSEQSDSTVQFSLVTFGVICSNSRHIHGHTCLH